MRLKILTAILALSTIVLGACASYNYVEDYPTKVVRTSDTTIEYTGTINSTGFNALFDIIKPGDTIVLWSEGGFVHLIDEFTELIQTTGAHIQVDTCVSACAVIALHGETVTAHSSITGRLGFHAPAHAGFRDIHPALSEVFSGGAKKQIANSIREAGYNEELVKLVLETPHEDIAWVHADELEAYKQGE